MLKKIPINFEWGYLCILCTKCAKKSQGVFSPPPHTFPNTIRVKGEISYPRRPFLSTNEIFIVFFDEINRLYHNPFQGSRKKSSANSGPTTKALPLPPPPPLLELSGHRNFFYIVFRASKKSSFSFFVRPIPPSPLSLSFLVVGPLVEELFFAASLCSFQCDKSWNNHQKGLQTVIFGC